MLFICGAGVSRTVGLPSFEGLVKGVYKDLGEDWQTHPAENEIMRPGGRLTGQYDRALRALERRLIGTDIRKAQTWRERIRAVVRANLAPPADADLTDHLCLLELSSRDAEHRNRLLTTNFDTLFERAWAKARGAPLPSHACQAMPQPGAASFNGVLHLHGRLADAELNLDDTDLVLTSAEFGDAYLRSGWASRYLYDVVRTHYLVLVGYGADDPPMRYLLEALEADRERFPDLKRVYAFSEPQDGDAELAAALWRAKGVEPIIYCLDEDDGHSLLYQTIREWSRYAENPTGWRRERLVALLAVDPTSDNEMTISEASSLLRHGDADWLLGEISPSATWLPLLWDQRTLADGIANFRPWIASRLSDPDMVRACAPLNLHEDAWRHIEWRLAQTERRPTAEFVTAWRWIKLAWRAQRSSRRARAYLLPGSTTVTEDEFGFREAVVELFVPRLTVRRPIVWPFQKEPEDAPVTARSLVESDFEVAGSYPAQEVLNSLPPNPVLEERLLLSLCRGLHDALDLARDVEFISALGRSSLDVPSISDHSQNNDRGPLRHPRQVGRSAEDPLARRPRHVALRQKAGARPVHLAYAGRWCCGDHRGGSGRHGGTADHASAFNDTGQAYERSAQRLHSDDTTVPVLAKGKTTTGRLWTYMRDDRPFGGPDPPATLFFYSPDRTAAHWLCEPAERFRSGDGHGQRRQIYPTPNVTLIGASPVCRR